jgi:hypothetical protein
MQVSVTADRDRKRSVAQHTVKLASERLSLATGTSRQVSISLDRAGAKLLATRHRLSALLTISTGTGNHRRTFPQPLTFEQGGKRS